MTLYLLPAEGDPQRLLAPGLFGATMPLAHCWNCIEHGRYFTAWCGGCDTKYGRPDSRRNTADFPATLTAKIAEGVMGTPNALILVHEGKVVVEGCDRVQRIRALPVPAELWMPAFPTIEDAAHLARRFVERFGGEAVVRE